MSEKPAWEAFYKAEMQNAEAARRSGNEGKARVCARRAAGAVIGEYLIQRLIETLARSLAVNGNIFISVGNP